MVRETAVHYIRNHGGFAGDGVDISLVSMRPGVIDRRVFHVFRPICDPSFTGKEFMGTTEWFSVTCECCLSLRPDRDDEAEKDMERFLEEVGGAE